MPEPYRLTQQEYATLCQNLSALDDALVFLQHVSRGLSPGMQVSIEAAYREIWHKTDTALRVLVQRSQIAMAVWEVQQREHATYCEEDHDDAHP